MRISFPLPHHIAHAFFFHYELSNSMSLNRSIVGIETNLLDLSFVLITQFADLVFAHEFPRIGRVSNIFEYFGTFSSTLFQQNFFASRMLKG